MKLELIEKRTEVPGVQSFIFKPLEKFEWKSGQYLHYVLHHLPTDDRGSDRWFTIATAPFEETVMITTRFDGKLMSSFKKKLDSLNIGAKIEATNVTGDFVIRDPHSDYVFIAGGIGITPFRAIIKELDHLKQPINITLLYANRAMDNIVFKEEFENIAKQNQNFKIHYVISPEIINENKIREIVPDISKPIFYVSGPEPMVESLGNELKEMGVSEDHLTQDWFPGYEA